MADWRNRLVRPDDDAALRRILKSTERIAVVGMKPERERRRAAFYVPDYLRRAGYDIVPVNGGGEAEVVGRRVHPSVAAVPEPVDMALVFRRPEALPDELPDLLAASPPVVWFQRGIRNDEVAERLAREGIEVVQDRCIKTAHRRLLGG